MWKKAAVSLFVGVPAATLAAAHLYTSGAGHASPHAVTPADRPRAAPLWSRYLGIGRAAATGCNAGWDACFGSRDSGEERRPATC